MFVSGLMFVPYADVDITQGAMNEPIWGVAFRRFNVCSDTATCGQIGVFCTQDVLRPLISSEVSIARSTKDVDAGSFETFGVSRASNMFFIVIHRDINMTTRLAEFDSMVEPTTFNGTVAYRKQGGTQSQFHVEDSEGVDEVFT